MIKIILRIIGFVFLAIGIVGILTPIPFGLFFLVIAMLFLVPTTPSFALRVRKLRQRYPTLDDRLRRFSRRLPFVVRRILKETESDLY